MPCTYEATVLLLNHMGSLNIVSQAQPVKKGPHQVKRQNDVQQ